MQFRRTGAIAPEIDEESAEERRLQRLDPDQQFVYHLGEPSSWQALKDVDPAVLIAECIPAHPNPETTQWSEASSREIFEWQKRHYEQHGVGASAADLESHFGIIMSDPETHPDELVDRLYKRHATNVSRDLIRSIAQESVDAEDNRIILHKLAKESQAASAQFLRQDKCVIRMTDVEDAAQEFLLDPYLPLGVFTLLQGPGGVGKSILGIYLITMVEGNVLIIGDEDHPKAVKRRLIEAGVDLDRVSMWDLDRHPLSFPSGEAALEERIKADDVSFVILDTVTELLDARLKGSDSDDVISVVMMLRRVAARTNTAILGIGHTNRNTSGDTQQRVGGSIQWYNRSKSALFLGEDPIEDGIVHVFHDKHNYSREGEPLQFERKAREDRDVYLDLVGESELEFAEVFNPREHKATKIERVAAFLAEWEIDCPVDLSVLRDEFGDRYPDISEETLKRGRTAANWDTQRVGATYWGGPAASFRGWTPPDSDEPLTAAQRIRGRS